MTSQSPEVGLREAISNILTSPTKEIHEKDSDGNDLYFKEDAQITLENDVGRIMQAISTYTEREKLKRAIEEIDNLGGKTIHASENGGFCKVNGEQFRECLQCLKDKRINQLTAELGKLEQSNGTGK